MGDNSTSTCGYNIYIAYAGLPLGVFAICDSVLSIATICRTRELHTNQYIFIASLAVADIILSLSFLATAIIRVPWINALVHRRDIVNNLAYGSIFSSIVLAGLHMSTVAVDRYIRIAHPFYYIHNMTKQRTIKILSLVYALSVLNACIPAIVYRRSNYRYCISIHQPMEYFYFNVAIIFISVIIVLGCYFKIARIAISHKKSAMTRRLQTGDIAGAEITRNNRAVVMRSVRFFVAMCGVHFILCIPPFVMDCVGFYVSVPDFIIVVAAHCFPLHSVLNFVICCRMNKSFYKALKRTCVDMKMYICRRCYQQSL